MVCALMRMSEAFIVYGNATRAAGIIVLRSLRNPATFFVMTWRVESYSRAPNRAGSLAALKRWQLVDVQLHRGVPDDILPEQPILSRAVVSNHLSTCKCRALCSDLCLQYS
jgi:hypothetical protein